MYGSLREEPEGAQMDEEAAHRLVERSNRNGDEMPATFRFEDPFDTDFWDAVHERFTKKVEQSKAESRHEYEAEKSQKADTILSKDGFWSAALDEIRAERIRSKYENTEGDPVVAIIKEWYGPFKQSLLPNERESILPSLEKQISKLALILVDQECEKKKCVLDEGKHKCKYGAKSNPLVYKDEEKIKRSLLHLAAEENLVILADGLIKRFPMLLYIDTRGGPRNVPNRMPLEIAMLKFNDDVASELIKNMSHDRVRKLMEYDPSEKCTRIKFHDYILRADMQKSVIALLDCMINPDWHGIVPVNENDKEKSKEEQWSKIPDIPMRYHFFYRILDGDKWGRSPKTDDGRTVKDEDFDFKGDSCFGGLLRSPHKEIVIRHPVVRKLADRKWQAFGKIRVRLFAAIYLLFLIVMSIALLSAVTVKDPLKYNRSTDDFARVVCEALTLLAAVVYLGLEIDQMAKEKTRYLRDKYNYLDVFGILSLFALIPLRITGEPSQWSVAAASYLVNFLRIFKYFPAWPLIGTYTKVLAQMLVQDITKFAVVYLIVMFAFAGSVFMALKATNGLANVSGFWNVILREIRVLAEGNPFSDSYSAFNVAVVVLIMVNMLVVLIMLVNMLIAQLSWRYEQAQNDAAIQYDIDKTVMVTRLERSYFKRWNLRFKHYKDGDFVAKSEIKDLLTSWESLKKEMDDNSLLGQNERTTAKDSASGDQFVTVKRQFCLCC